MEKRIAEALFYKNKRDRFLFERQKYSSVDTIAKLPNIVDSKLCIMKSAKFPSVDNIIATMKANGVGDKCYVISEYEAYDSQYKPLRDAVEQLNRNGFASLIIGLPSGFSHLKEESWASSQPNCFIKPNIRLDKKPW